jgi:hypothetical protein
MGLSLTGFLAVIAVSFHGDPGGKPLSPDRLSHDPARLSHDPARLSHDPARLDLDGALSRARAASRFVIVILTAPGAVEAPAEGGAMRSSCPTIHPSCPTIRPGWLAAIHPHDHVILAADEEPARARFAGRSFPLFLVLDGEGREIGRIEGAPPDEVIGRRFRHIVEAAERHRGERPSPTGDTDAEALFWRGAYRWNQGEHFLAADCFRKVCALASSGAAVDGRNLVLALGRLGEHALDRGDYVEAEERFRQAMLRTRDAESACGAALGLSLSLRRQGKVGDAVSVLEEALAGVEPSWLDDQALFALGYLRRELGERAQARRRFEECAARFPQSLHGSRARRYLECEDLAPRVGRERPRLAAAED